MSTCFPSPVYHPPSFNQPPVFILLAESEQEESWGKGSPQCSSSSTVGEEENRESLWVGKEKGSAAIWSLPFINRESGSSHYASLIPVVSNRTTQREEAVLGLKVRGPDTIQIPAPCFSPGCFLKEPGGQGNSGTNGGVIVGYACVLGVHTSRGSSLAPIQTADLFRQLLAESNTHKATVGPVQGEVVVYKRSRCTISTRQESGFGHSPPSPVFCTCELESRNLVSQKTQFHGGNNMPELS